jgi:hypothetical protein
MKKMFFFSLLVAALVLSLVGCDGNGDFVSSTNDTTSNDVATLGIIGTTASSSNTGVATVAIESGKIKITSVAEGVAVITVKNALDHAATINVTVAKNGTIAIGTITKYVVSNEKTIVGNWTKTVDSNIGELTVNSNNTWSLSFNATPLVSNGTWDTDELKFVYDYDSDNPQNITLSYVLSEDGNQLTLSGEDVNLIGGSTPWNRVENGIPEGINSGDPDNTTLTAFHITAEVITAVKTAAGGDYKGWILANLENGGTQLQLYWTGRSEAQHNAVVTALRTTLNGPADDFGPNETNIENDTPSTGTGIMVGANGSYSSAEWRYSTMYAKTACIVPEWNLNMPAGNLVINFWEEDD